MSCVAFSCCAALSAESGVALQCHCLITAKYSISSLLCTTLVRASVHCVTATLQDWPCHQAACSMRHPLAFQAGTVRSCSPQRSRAAHWCVPSDGEQRRGPVRTLFALGFACQADISGNLLV
uniref:Secreted protein n=1 Tax=Knipowitschia caucasica TaxID=637954 RepID=A0AAV2JL69_KNICA